MCPQKGVEKLYSSEFFEYCKTMKEDSMCSYYNNLRLKGSLSQGTSALLTELKRENPIHCEQLIEKCKAATICPYEISLLLAKSSNVIVGDYSYVFNPLISEVFMTKLGKELEDAIIIIDEAHNLPGRIRDTLSEAISELTIKGAIREAKEFKRDELRNMLDGLLQGFLQFSKTITDERSATRPEFENVIKRIGDYSSFKNELIEFGDIVREQKQRSFAGALGDFLAVWTGPEEGFVRFFRQSKRGLVLYYRALDPAILSRSIIEQSHSTIAMSGTLTPTEMFRDILGFPKTTKLEEYESPFPKDNRLALIIPATSTKYKSRSEEEYKRIAQISAALAEEIPGNVALFFPSYKLRDDVGKYMAEETNKELLYEQRGMSRDQKAQLLQKFISLRKRGSVLMGIVRGSFGEGIDLPGDYLNGVVIVGLPLAKPDLETNALIEHFNIRYGKGLEYAYIFPAINLTLQSAGRCIRSEQDKGVVVMLDERYAYPRYKACFPKEWGFIVTRDFEPFVTDFFRRHKQGF